MGACADECKSEFQVTQDKRLNGTLPARSGVPGVTFVTPGVARGACGVVQPSSSTAHARVLAHWRVQRPPQ